MRQEEIELIIDSRIAGIRRAMLNILDTNIKSKYNLDLVRDLEIQESTLVDLLEFIGDKRPLKILIETNYCRFL